MSHEDLSGLFSNALDTVISNPYTMSHQLSQCFRKYTGSCNPATLPTKASEGVNAELQLMQLSPAGHMTRGSDIIYQLALCQTGSMKLWK